MQYGELEMSFYSSTVSSFSSGSELTYREEETGSSDGTSSIVDVDTSGSASITESASQLGSKSVSI